MYELVLRPMYKMEMLEQQDHISIKALMIQMQNIFGHLGPKLWLVFKHPPEITQCYRVFQDTQYYILLTVGTGIQVSGQKEESKTHTNHLCFYFIGKMVVPLGWYP